MDTMTPEETAAAKSDAYDKANESRARDELRLRQQIEQLREALREANATIAALNEHTDKYEDAMLKERRLAEERIKDKAGEIERLSGLLWGGRCVYCGEVVGKDRQNQDLSDDVLREHVRACPKHPFRPTVVGSRPSIGLVASS